MSLKRVCISLVLAFSAQSLLAQISKPLNCAKLDFTTYDNKCCQTPVGDLLSPSAMQMCNPKKDKNLNKWVNEYMFNKLSSAKKDNGIELTTPANVKTLCNAATFINCLVEHYKIMAIDGTWYNGKNAIALVASARTNYWKEVFEDVLGEDNLKMLVPMFNETVECKTGKKTSNVHIGALFLVQMFQNYITFACNDPVEPTPKNKCDIIENNLATCHSFLEDSFYVNNKLATARIEAIKNRLAIKKSAAKAQKNSNY